MLTASWLFAVALGAQEPTAPAAAPPTAAPPTAEPPAPATTGIVRPVDEALRVLVLEPSGALDDGARKTVASLVAIELAKAPGVDVISSTDVKNMATLEAERQTLGCDEAGSCLAELAGAMGARFVVFGDAANLQDLTALNLSLFDSKEARPVGRVTIHFKDLDALPRRVPAATRSLVAGSPDLGARMAQAPPLEVDVVSLTNASTRSLIWNASFIGAGALIGAGGLAFDLTSRTSSNDRFDAWDLIGPGGLVVGGAIIGAGLLLNPFEGGDG